MLNIVHTPATVLTTPAQPIEIFDDRLKTLIAQMKEALEAQDDPQGVGLAAPQVGHSQALFIMKPTETASIQVCINPKILQVEGSVATSPKSGKKSLPLEGCLSIPRIWSLVKRARKIRLEYQNESGKKMTKWFIGFKAVIVQHEMDHLQGILFTQRALEQQTPLYEEDKKGKLKKMDY